MDKIYEDFTTKMLPQIQAGMTITKDYFTDLFARYIKYLIITDSIYLGVSLFLTVLFFVFTYIAIGWTKKDGDFFPLVIIFGIGIITSFVASVANSFDLVKDFYIPEVRVYEQLKPMTK